MLLTPTKATAAASAEASDYSSDHVLFHGVVLYVLGFSHRLLKHYDPEPDIVNLLPLGIVPSG